MRNKYLWKKTETELQGKNNSRNVRVRLQCLTYEQIPIQLTSKYRTTDHMGTAPEKKMQAALKI